MIINTIRVLRARIILRVCFIIIIIIIMLTIIVITIIIIVLVLSRMERNW